MQRIQEVWRNIKGIADASLAEWGMMALIALACIGAFALGRLSALEAGKPLISVTEAPQMASAASIVKSGVSLVPEGRGAPGQPKSPPQTRGFLLRPTPPRRRVCDLPRTAKDSSKISI